MTARSMKHRVEAVIIGGLYKFFGALPIDAASNLGGWLGRSFGPHLWVSRRAYRNLRRVFPDMPKVEQARIVRAMWDNLGRVAAEFPHLQKFTFGPGQRVEVEGLENILFLRDDDQPGIFFASHIGNWELNAYCAARNGLPLHLIYRAANNPYLSWIYENRAIHGVKLIPKGASGARMALDTLKKGGHLGMLVDQKMNDGIAVPFFGIPAMTAPALAQFALRFNCPLVPARIYRLKGCHFKMVLSPPLPVVTTDNRHDDIVRIMSQVNRILETWVRETPEQWLWLHNRWSEEVPNRDPDAAE